MTVVTRMYHQKDVDMLITASTIVESAILQKDFLQSKRTTWQDPFFENIRDHIDNVIQEYLGLDKAKDLRKATQVVKGVFAYAINDIADLKVQIIEDFKKDKTEQQEVLKQLGFQYHKEAQNGDQEALINFLFQFKTNLTDSLRAQIEARGTSPGTLNAIIDYANKLKESNITQETLKGTKKEITAEAINKFNNIYNQVISIAKIAARFFKDNKSTQEQFSFTKVAKNLNNKK